MNCTLYPMFQFELMQTPTSYSRLNLCYKIYKKHSFTKPESRPLRLVLQDRRLFPQEHIDQKVISPNRTIISVLRQVKSICMVRTNFKRSVAARTALDVVRPFHSKVKVDL